MGEGEVVELDIFDGGGIPALEPGSGLAVVGGGASEVDGEAAGGEVEREVEELIEVALGWEWDDNDGHAWFLSCLLHGGGGYCLAVEFFLYTKLGRKGLL